MATTHVRSSEVQTVTDLCTRSARSRRPTQLPLRTRSARSRRPTQLPLCTRSARSRRPTQLPTTSAAFTGCRSKQRGLAQPKVFLYILARGATNYSTTYATKSTTQRVRTNKHTTDKDVTTCNAHRDEKDNEEPKGGSTVRSHMYLPRCTVHTCNKATPNGKTVRYGNNHPRGTRMVRTSMHKHVGDIDATVHSDVG